MDRQYPVEENEEIINSEDEQEENDSDYNSEDENFDFESDVDEDEKEPEHVKPSFMNIGGALSDDEDEDDETEEEDDDNYLQKFDENTQKNIIADYYPELQTHNASEVEVLSTVVRNEDGMIIDPLHKTVPFITRYEKARIIGERAKQINCGAKPLVQVDATIIDGYLIALKEYEEKKIPFIVKRPLPSGGCEYWKFKDLEQL